MLPFRAEIVAALLIRPPKAELSLTLYDRRLFQNSYHVSKAKEVSLVLCFFFFFDLRILKSLLSSHLRCVLSRVRGVVLVIHRGALFMENRIVLKAQGVRFTRL